ncbi:hypothetical protein PHISP_04681 [Aspergillus sp. HF37]|nr:hypothetical protein PHISP_04681 [Aspergillus sp. HF37]
MPKPKKQHGAAPKKSRKMNTFAKLSTTTADGKTKPGGGSGAKTSQTQNGKKNQQQQKRKPIVPFGRGDRILLIGEGDFSFARSLVTQYKCHNVLATCYEDRETLRAKYPQAEGRNIPDMLNAGRSRSGGEEEDGDEHDTEPGHDAESEQEDDDVHRHHDDARERNQPPPSPRVLYSVDARKLGAPAGGGKEVRYGLARRRQKDKKKEDKKTTPSGHAGAGAWDVICFNFPHVGGLSTDVNRQVRANQELLVGFFKAAVSLLSVPVSEDEDEDEDEHDHGDGYGYGSDDYGKEPRRTQPGQILVTLFEGEPYTLWNIKDLARHAGLRVVTSFRFPWSSYEGYAHARTLGEVEAKQGGRGGWRGQDREARMYVFENAQVEPAKKEGGKKRGRAESESDSD